MSIISERKPVPVNIGSLTVYCDEFKVSGDTLIREQATVTGSTVLTNDCRFSTKITISGRYYDENFLLGIVIPTDSLSGSDTTYNIEYRGVIFGNCRVKSYTVEDKGLDYIYMTLVLIGGEYARNGGS